MSNIINADVLTNYSTLLSSSHLKCPECSFDLSGNTTAVCPECGYHIKISLISTKDRYRLWLCYIRGACVSATILASQDFFGWASSQINNRPSLEIYGLEGTAKWLLITTVRIDHIIVPVSLIVLVFSMAYRTQIAWARAAFWFTSALFGCLLAVRLVAVVIQIAMYS